MRLVSRATCGAVFLAWVGQTGGWVNEPITKLTISVRPRRALAAARANGHFSARTKALEITISLVDVKTLDVTCHALVLRFGASLSWNMPTHVRYAVLISFRIRCSRILLTTWYGCVKPRRAMTNSDNCSDHCADERHAVAESEDAAIPHDAIFFKILSKPEHAAAELKCIFPSTLVAAIDWSTLQPRPLRFVDAKLSSKYADVLFSVDLAGKEALIYILFEHKSVADRWTLLQLLEYKARIWRGYLEDHDNNGTTFLPVILPVVLHHSENGWTCPKRFREYFDVPTELLHVISPYMLDFGILLDDISKVDGAALMARPLTPEGHKR